jgi:nitrogenase-stabilizing/protective protein
MSLDEDMQDLVSAEDFLDFFQIAYDAERVKVYRLHILQRFHDYLSREKANQLTDEAEKHARYTQLLQQAYQDFVNSDAQTEKVFKIFRRDEPQEVKVSVDSLRRS